MSPEVETKALRRGTLLAASAHNLLGSVKLPKRKPAMAERQAMQVTNIRDEVLRCSTAGAVEDAVSTHSERRITKKNGRRRHNRSSDSSLLANATFVELQSISLETEKNPFVIGTNNSIVNGWDAIILIFVLYEAIATPLDFSFGIEATNKHIKQVNTVADVAFILDLGLSFFKSFVDKNGEVVSDLGRIQRKYMTFWYVRFTCYALAAEPALGVLPNDSPSPPPPPPLPNTQGSG
jgi:hypothetical protein